MWDMRHPEGWEESQRTKGGEQEETDVLRERSRRAVREKGGRRADWHPVSPGRVRVTGHPSAAG